jgi:hypothetical protein
MTFFVMRGDEDGDFGILELHRFEPAFFLARVAVMKKTGDRQHKLVRDHEPDEDNRNDERDAEIEFEEGLFRHLCAHLLRPHDPDGEVQSEERGAGNDAERDNEPRRPEAREIDAIRDGRLQHRSNCVLAGGSSTLNLRYPFRA